MSLVNKKYVSSALTLLAKISLEIYYRIKNIVLIAYHHVAKKRKIERKLIRAYSVPFCDLAYKSARIASVVLKHLAKSAFDAVVISARVLAVGR